MIIHWKAAAAVLALAMSGSAFAANYNYNVIYSGANIAALAPGSDDPLATVLMTGDTFTYQLTAAGAGEWTVLTNSAVFPRFALSGDFGPTTITYNLTLNQNAGSVFSFGETAGVCCAHLGTNFLALPMGLVFDQWSLVGTVDSTGNTGPSLSLLPWPNLGPEIYAPGDLSFASGAIPEPASWVMLIAGFGLVGFAARRRRTAVVA